MDAERTFFRVQVHLGLKTAGTPSVPWGWHSLRAQEKSQQFQIGRKSEISFSFHQLNTNNETGLPGAWQPRLVTVQGHDPREISV